MVSVDTAIKRFRRMREAEFNSTVRITRAGTGEAVFDPATGNDTLPGPTEVYEGASQIREATWSGVDLETGETEVRKRGGAMWLPHDTAVLEDDRVEVLTSTYDAQLPGRVFRITDVLLDDWQVARKVLIEKVTT